MTNVAAHWQRHQLVWLAPGGWQRLVAGATEPGAGELLAHWAGADLPLVVTRQPAPQRPALLALGLPAPSRWQRRRLAVAVPREDVARVGRFPAARAVTALLPAGLRGRWQQLCERLDDLGARTLVYGSHGWQCLTGLDHLRPGSDLDLCVAVHDAAQADAVAGVLAGADVGLPRVDGELQFPDGAAVAWREWQDWRAGRGRSVLVKRLDGPSLWTALPAALAAGDMSTGARVRFPG